MQERLLSCVWDVPFADVQSDFAEFCIFGGMGVVVIEVIRGNIEICKKIAQIGYIGNIEEI
jgi:hypothetical protein